MPIMYKLVSEDMLSKNGMKWEIGKTNKATGSSNKLCTDGVLHCYSSPELASLLYPLHLQGGKFKLLEVACSPILDGDGLKFATKEQTPTRVVTLPVFTKEQRVAFGIKCALLVFKREWFIKWANSWLDGSNRNESAARSAESAAWSAESAAWSAESAARSAAWSAARSAAESAAWSAAESAAWSAESAARSAAWSAESAAWSAESAARSAAWSAESAAWSTESAESAAKTLKEIAEWVLTNIT